MRSHLFFYPRLLAVAIAIVIPLGTYPQTKVPGDGSVAGESFLAGIAAYGNTWAFEDPVEILSVINDSGTTYVLTNKQNTCVVIKEKATGKTWRGKTNLQGLLKVRPGPLPEDTTKLEIVVETSCAPGPQDTDTASIEGVVTLEIKTNNRQKVTLTAPADIRPGDTISMSVDSTDTATLSGIVFDVDGTKISPRDNILTFQVPQVAMEARIITISDLAGREIGRDLIPINRKALTPGSSIPNADFTAPRFGQTGQIISIPGKYDGISSNSNASFTSHGPQPTVTTLAIAAKSPRGTFARLPSNAPAGPGILTVSEGGVPQQFPFNILKVVGTADRASIRRGETINAHFEVSGCQGLASIILVLRNLSPSVIRFVSTPSGSIATKLNTNSDGVAKFNEKLTGISAGAFTVTGTVTNANPVAGNDKCKCNCEFAKPPITSDTTRGADGSGTENTFSANMKRADCTGSKCSVRGISHSWSVGATSTATFKVREGTENKEKLVVDVTKDGTLVITVTVTVECSDGTKCSDTATYTVKVKG